MLVNYILELVQGFPLEAWDGRQSVLGYNGLTNAPATFQRLMDTVLRVLHWEKSLVYLDDIIVLGPTFEETLENLRCVMRRLKAAGLKLKASKCYWFQCSVKYLGKIVSSHLTRKSVRFSWDQSCQNAYERFKSMLVTAPVLAYPKAEEQYILDTDASNHAIGAVLSQMQDGEERVIAYASKALHGGQENYCTTKRELLAAVAFVEHFRYFLFGTHFTIRTDHASLKWLRNFKNIDSMLARWLATLEKYHYESVHRKGSQHSNADALSRLPLRKCPREDCPRRTVQVCPITARPEPAETDGWLLGRTNQELSQWQRNDPVLSKVIKWLESSPERPKNAA